MSKYDTNNKDRHEYETIYIDGKQPMKIRKGDR